MKRLFQLRNLMAAGVVALAVAWATPTALAGSCQTTCYYKTVVTYVEVEKPYVAYVTKYDHCGKPYLAKAIRYKTYQVPVETRVKVCY